jgi:diamine N-acetyltransferase
MKIRKLKMKDATLMLEWMHDLSVVKDLKTDFSCKTLQDCEHFINMSQNMVDDIHLAVVDDEDEYMGTVSLKHIERDTAEFGIVIRKVAMGKGYSQYGMSEILKIGFDDLKIKKIYWCVSADNKRALRFYDKNRFERIILKNDEVYEIVRTLGIYSEDNIEEYIWYLLKNKNVFSDL